MTIATIPPRFQKAIDSGKQLYYFADLWKSVLNDKIDSQADFQASTASTNMDFTSRPGFARLSAVMGNGTVSQTGTNGSLGLVDGSLTNRYIVQKILVPTGRKMSKITVGLKNTGTSSAVLVSLYNQQPPNTGNGYQGAWPGLVFAKNAAVNNGTNGPIDFVPPAAISIPSGTYYLVIEPSGSFPADLAVLTNNTNAYADGELSYASGGAHLSWVTDTTKDIYFSLTMSGYKSSGSFTSRILDLGKTPENTGFFQIAQNVPNGTSVSVTLRGSGTGAFAGEETTYPDVTDGWIAPAGMRFWIVDISMLSDSALEQSPAIDEFELYYPDDRVRFRQRGVKLSHVDEEILREYQPLLVPGSYTTSELKPIERVSSLGTFSIELQDTVPDIIQRIVSDSPLKNFRAAIYVGADDPGFRISDLFRACIGIVDTADISPRYRGSVYSLSLKVKNPILELKRKAPLPDETGLLDFEIVSINEDGSHALNSTINVMRGSARIPGRYIDSQSFLDGVETAGSGDPAPSAHVVRRSNSAIKYSDNTDAPDTRVKTPTEITSLLAPLALIADGYIVIDETGRIKYVHHDMTGSYESTWADEAMVREGLDAIPIESVGTIALGYGDMLYNLCYCGCEWSGAGDKWDQDFKKVFGNYNRTSGDEFAPGKDEYKSIMEANMIEVSKWLGPEDGYNGKSLAQAIAKRMTDRFSFPPARIQGAVLPVSQYIRGVGSIVRIWSREFAKLGRRGIAQSESLRFMITKQQYDQGRNKVVFDLLELT